eukprot:gene14492-20516_t
MLVILALSLLFTSPLVVQASSQVQGSLDTFDALIASLEKHPGFESHVRIGYDKDGLRGLYATRDIPAVRLAQPVWIVSSRQQRLALVFEEVRHIALMGFVMISLGGTGGAGKSSPL